MKLLDNGLKNKHLQNFYFAFIFLILLAITTYFYPLQSGHDLAFHVMRLDALIDALRDGTFSIYLDYKAADGYGYATKWFYSDLMLIPFGLIGLLTSTITAYKSMIIGYTVLCGILSYISGYKIFNNRYIAFILCILYTFSYYRLYDVYNRAALGETICLTFIPLALWGAHEIVIGNCKKWYIIASAFSLMIYSHINTPVQVSVVIGIFFIIKYKSFIKEPVRLAYLALAAFVSILLTSYFLFPLLEQMLSNDFYYALTDERAISFPVHEGEPIKYIIRGLFSGATYVVPEIAGIGIVLTFTVLLRSFIGKNEYTKLGDCFLVLGLICLFIISPLYPWQVFPFNIIGFIQFSWRFYSIATMVLSIAGAVYFYSIFDTDKRRYWVGIPLLSILTIIVITNSGQVFSNNFKEYKGYDTRHTNGYGLMGAEYMPANIPNTKEFFHERGNDSIYKINRSTKLENYKRELRTLEFDITEYQTRKFAEIAELPLIYYKGYKAELMPLNGMAKVPEVVKVVQSPNGLVMIPIDKTGHIKVYFGGTMIQNVSPYISLISYILLICYIIWFNRKQKNDTKTRKAI